MSTFHKNTSPYKKSISTRTINRWDNKEQNRRKKALRLALPSGIIVSPPPKRIGPRQEQATKSGIEVMHERIALATNSNWIDNEEMFKHKLDRLQERLSKSPIPKVKDHTARIPLFPQYTLYLKDLDSNFRKQLQIERNTKVEKLRKKRDTILLRQTLYHWRKQKNIQSNVKLFLAGRKSVFVNEAFSTWIKYKKRIQRERRYMFAILRAKTKKYKFHRETKLKIQLFELLLGNVYHARQQLVQAERYFNQFVCKRKLVQAFRELKSYTYTKKRKRILKKKIIQYHEQSLQCKMYVVWLNFVYERKFLKYYMNKLILRFKHKELFSGWDAWIEFIKWHRKYGDFTLRFPHLEEKESMPQHPHILCFCLPLAIRKLYKNYHVTHHDKLKDMFRLLLVLLVVMVVINIVHGGWSGNPIVYMIFFGVMFVVSVVTYIVGRKFHIELNCIREGHLHYHSSKDDENEKNSEQTYDVFAKV